MRATSYIPGIASIRELPCLLDDRRPAVDLAEELCPQRLRRGIGLPDRLGVDIGEPLHQLRILQRSLQRADELLRRRGRRAGRRIEAMPDADLESLEARLVGGRKLWQRLKPRLCGHRIGLDALAADRAGGCRRLLTAEIDLSAQQIVEQWTAATVGHGGELGPNRALEQHPTQVIGGTEA